MLLGVELFILGEATIYLDCLCCKRTLYQTEKMENDRQ